MGEKRYILAMYDIRGKQKFIFRKGKIQEVIGASAVIRDLFEDYLYPVANSLKYDPTGDKEAKIRKNFCEKDMKDQENRRALQNALNEAMPNDAIYRYMDSTGKKREEDTTFTWERFRQHLSEGYLGEVIYDGGGNFFVLYKDEPTCVAINRRFTKRVMEKTYSLKVLCSYVAVDPEQNDFKNDRRRLYERNRENEANESVTIPATVLPFTQVDRKTSMPLVGTKTVHDELQQVTVESRAKLEKYDQEKEKPDFKKDELILDNLVQEKGVSSLLAIIHIDGNNMGAMFETALGNSVTYESCVAELRRLSEIVKTVHIDNRKDDIDGLLTKLNDEESETSEIDKKAYEAEEKANEQAKESGLKHRRAIVAAGDDFTIICKAQDALEVTEGYLDGLWKDIRKEVKDDKGRPRQWSACAGIAVFHSHAPFADAYRIAEECCDSAKGVMKEKKLVNAELIDFEYLQSGIDMSLEKIREIGNERISSRPWVYRADATATERLLSSEAADHSGTEPAHLHTWVESTAEITAADPEKNRHLDVGTIDDEFQKVGRSNIKGLAAAALDGETGFRLELERMAAHSRIGQDQGAGKILELYKTYSKAGYEESFRSLVYDYVIFHDLWFIQDNTQAAEAKDEGKADERISSVNSEEGKGV